MASINLKVKSDFEQASKDLKKFGTLTESERKNVEKYQEQMKGKSMDSFIDKNRRLGAGMEANKGTTKAIIAQQKALEKQSIKLIKNGLDPQDESIEKLNDEYNRLQKEYDQTTTKTKKMEAASKVAANTLKAVGAAALVATGALVKNTFDIAKAGDEYAKQSSRIGLTAETLQELTFAADRQGVSSETLVKGLQKLNKNVGDAQAGFGALETALKDSNPELLEQLKNVESNEEAFRLSVEAIEGTSNALEKASLSQALFGKAGTELLTVTAAGTEGIAELREEARQYGIISNESAAQSERFVDAQTNLKATFDGVKQSLGVALIPIIEKGMEKFRDLIEVAKEIIPIIRDKMARAWINFGANSETILTKLTGAFKVFGVSIETAWIVAVNTIQLAFIQLGETIVVNVLGAVQKFLDVAAKLPFVGEKFAAVSDEVDALKQSFIENTEEVKQNQLDTIAAAEANKQAVKDEVDSNLEEIDRNRNARLDAIDIIKTETETAGIALVKNTADVSEETIEIAEETNIVILKDYKETMDKKSLLDDKSLSDYEAYATAIMDNAEELANGQQELDLATAASLATALGKATGSVELEAAGLALAAMDTIIKTFEETDVTDWEDILVTVIATAIGGALGATIVQGIRDAEEEIEELETEILNEVTSLKLDNAKALADQLYEIELESITNIENARLEEFTNALSEKERLALQSAGIIEESNLERVQRELDAAIAAGDTELEALKNNELIVEGIKQDAIDAQLKAEEDYNFEIQNIAYKKAVFDRDLAISQAKVDKEAAMAALPWYYQTDLYTDKKDKVEGNYDDLIGVIESTPLPPMPTAQTGTPLGGFNIGNTNGSSGTDNVGLNVGAGETVSVTPRGEGGQTQNIIVQIDRETIFNVINDGIEGGDVRITTDNIQSA